MKFPCDMVRHRDGHLTLRHESPAVGRVEVTASSRDEAAEKLRGEIRYRLETCPCTADAYEDIAIEIRES
jgi:hypothetical protein